MGVPFQVTFDCADPDRLATFWAAALAYEKQAPPEEHDTWEAFLVASGVPEDEWNSASAVVDPEGKGHRLYFQQVPESKTAKNRVHLDINVGERGAPLEERRAKADAEAERLVGLGATMVDPVESQYGEYWIVMNDPEGNEFCLQ